MAKHKQPKHKKQSTLSSNAHTSSISINPSVIAKIATSIIAIAGIALVPSTTPITNTATNPFQNVMSTGWSTTFPQASYGHAATRSQSRVSLQDTNHSTTSKTIPTVPVGVETGTWALGDEPTNIPYSKTPLEQAQDAMNAQTQHDLNRLHSDKTIDQGNGFGSSIERDKPLTLNKDIIAKYKESNLKNAPLGFNEHHDTGDIGNAYSFSQCTWWAYVRRHELGLPAGSHMGDGKNWAITARSLGYWVDHTPLIGDVIVFQPGQAGADGYYGHVGIVENVIHDNGKTYIVTSESSAEQNGKHFSRILANPERFEYIHY